MEQLQHTKQDSHHGLVIEVNSTGDSSVFEVQVCQGLEFSDVGNHCKRRVLNQNHHGVMIEDKSTGDSSATEAQNCQCLQFSDVRDLCKTQQESATSWGDDHRTNLSMKCSH
jgi:hypothetical protein